MLTSKLLLLPNTTSKAKARKAVRMDLVTGDNFQPSTKMIKMVQLLRETEDNQVNGRVDKTVVYSQCE